MKIFCIPCALLLAIAAHAQQPTLWRFDSTSTIGGHATTLVGAPKVVASDVGSVIHFQGDNTAGDAIFVDTNPLQGVLEYTLELVFRPSSAGRPEQRIFHVQEEGSQSRRMFEIRVHDDKWCVDTVAVNLPPPPAKPATTRSGIMLNCDAQHLFPLDRWYVLTTTYDGTTLRTYVNGALQGEVAVALLPLGNGGVSIGTRYTKRDYFTGDMYAARFTPRALQPGEFLRVPVAAH